MAGTRRRQRIVIFFAGFNLRRVRSYRGSRGKDVGSELSQNDLTITIGLLVVWGICLAGGLEQGMDKLVGISLLAWLAMVLGMTLAVLAPTLERWTIWIDGMAAGAMVASACLYLLPMAIVPAPGSGSVGIAAGLLLGSVLHVWARHWNVDGHAADACLTAITLHALGAGVVIGLIYAHMPNLGMLLGVAIMAHKLPAGYALARQRLLEGRLGHPVLWPACAVAVCIPVGLWVSPGQPGSSGLLFGCAAGLFLHVGLDFARPRANLRQAAETIRFVGALLMGAALIVGLKQGLG